MDSFCESLGRCPSLGSFKCLDLKSLIQAQVLGLVLEKSGSVAVGRLHGVLDRFLKARLVLAWAETDKDKDKDKG